MSSTFSDGFDSSPFPPARTVQPGSKLVIVAPSGPFDRQKFDTGLETIRRRYEVKYEEGIFERSGYFAGSDERRLAELLAAIRDPETDAILCARGGYGATRLLEKIDPSEVAEANKLLIGFSDVTALHALWARAGVRSIHGAMVASLALGNDQVVADWFATIEGKSTPESWTLESLAGGRAEGRLFGGNLAVLASLVGTPYAPPLDGCILFLEDVGERPYRVDRVLTSLRHAGWLQQCAGFVIGAFTEGDPGPDGVAVDEVIWERLGDLGVPVVTGFPAGHINDNEPLTFGAYALIDNGTVTIAS